MSCFGKSCPVSAMLPQCNQEQIIFPDGKGREAGQVPHTSAQGKGMLVASGSKVRRRKEITRNVHGTESRRG